MKWISTLNQDDLGRMKRLVKLAEDDKKEEILFQNHKYEISYIKSVIKLKEELIITPELTDLLTD